VRVLGGAGKGVAKVTIHMPTWKEEELAPASFAIPLDGGVEGIHIAKRWPEKR
jgi:hypothetical protein